MPAKPDAKAGQNGPAAARPFGCLGALPCGRIYNVGPKAWTSRLRPYGAALGWLACRTRLWLATLGNTQPYWQRVALCGAEAPKARLLLARLAALAALPDAPSLSALRAARYLVGVAFLLASRKAKAWGVCALLAAGYRQARPLASLGMERPEPQTGALGVPLGPEARPEGPAIGQAFLRPAARGKGEALPCPDLQPFGLPRPAAIHPSAGGSLC